MNDDLNYYTQCARGRFPAAPSDVIEMIGRAFEMLDEAQGIAQAHDDGEILDQEIQSWIEDLLTPAPTPLEAAFEVISRFVFDVEIGGYAEDNEDFEVISAAHELLARQETANRLAQEILE